jgi:hypothetical protein
VPDTSPSSAAGSESTHDLVRLLPAVRCVGVAAVLSVLGYLLVFVSGVFTYLNFLGNDRLNESPMVIIQLVGAVRQLIVSLVLIYISTLVWRYASAISTAIRTGLVDHSLLSAAQRRCWYAIACLALLLFVSSIAMPLLTLTLYQVL